MSDSCAVKNKSLEALLHHPAIWRGGRLASTQPTGISTGFSPIDDELSDHGWPLGALTELLTDNHGGGEFSLLAPALSQLTKGARGIALVGPPHLPYAPALQKMGVALDHCLVINAQSAADSWWATEQALRSGACGAVLAWTNSEQVSDHLLRRLQLAAAASNGIAFLYRPLKAAFNPSPAKLRLILTPATNSMFITFIKRSGLPGEKSIRIEIPGRRKSEPILSHVSSSSHPKIVAAQAPALKQNIRHQAFTH